MKRFDKYKGVTAEGNVNVYGHSATTETKQGHLWVTETEPALELRNNLVNLCLESARDTILILRRKVAYNHRYVHIICL